MVDGLEGCEAKWEVTTAVTQVGGNDGQGQRTRGWAEVVVLKELSKVLGTHMLLILITNSMHCKSNENHISAYLLCIAMCGIYRISWTP